MDRECNCSLPSKVNGKCVYEGKCGAKYIIYQVECSKCDAIYIGYTQQTFKKRMDGHLSDVKRLLKNGQKSDSFAAHFVQHFNSTTSRTELRKCMTLKVLKQLNPIGSMKTFTKPNCNLLESDSGFPWSSRVTNWLEYYLLFRILNLESGFAASLE